MKTLFGFASRLAERMVQFIAFKRLQGYDYTAGAHVLRIRVLIGLLYSTGLRISEALALNVGDVDLKQATLFIHRGKFGKERLVPLAAWEKQVGHSCPTPGTTGQARMPDLLSVVLTCRCARAALIRQRRRRPSAIVAICK